MNRDNHLIFEALKLHNYEKQDYKSDGSGRELKYFKDKVKGFLEQGKEPSVEQLEQAIDKAMLYTNPRFFMSALHNELLHMRGKKRKALDIPYLPPEGKADYQFIKGWLKREMIGELMVHRSGPMHHENEENAETSSNSQNVQLEKQIKMLVNNALRATFAAIETLEGIDSLSYSGEIDALTVNLDEEVGRLMDMLDEKMPKQHSAERDEVSGSDLENAESASKNNIVQSNITNSSELFK